MQAFTYEVQEHEQPLGVPRVYEPIPDPMVTYQFLMGQPLPTPISVQLGAGFPGPIVWGAPVACPLIVSPLNIQQASFVVFKRWLLGIPLNFANPFLIMATALGVLPPPAQIPYIQHALRGGGYLSDTACVLYNLINHIIYFPAILGPVNGAWPEEIILQVANVSRVSKNLRELSYNTLLLGSPVYDTIRENILWFYNLLLPGQIPQSVTIISADHLQ